MHILFILKPRLIVIYAYALYREATPNRDLYIYSIVNLRLIMIYAHALYREATPNRDLYTYSVSWSQA